MKIKEISINNFRSIGDKPVTINLIKKISVIIGKNNSGKSNILKALQKVKQCQSNKFTFGELDYHNRNQSKPFRFTFHLISDDPFKEFGIPKSYKGEIFFNYEYSQKEGHPISIGSCFHLLKFPDWNEPLGRRFNRRFSSKLAESEFEMEMNKTAEATLPEILKNLPDIYILPQFRQITPGAEHSIEGKGIIETLDRFQHPTIGHDEDKIKFQKVEELIQKLIHLPKAKLEIVDKKHILIENEGLRIPLESYGTGVHELIILATALISLENVIFCIEEPEIHFHPLLQKELLNFLKNETQNSYVLTTHSNAFLNTDNDIAVIHLWKDNNITLGRCIESTSDALKIIKDLGIQPSDIFQANFVIWVEGPSDRIYLMHWLALLCEDLKVGIDYEIMHYTGKLLSHVSLESEGINPESFVQLLRINQNSAIIMDRDRKAPDKEINKTKQRICEECEKNGVLSWVTHGREIENYLPSHTVESVYSEWYGGDKKIDFGRFDKLEDKIKETYGDELRSSHNYGQYKPKFARLIAPKITKEDINKDQELNKKLNELINKIKTVSHQLNW